MTDRLSRIIGTEEDRSNCPFYFKIGACRHGDRCNRTHLRPTFSNTLLFPHMYIRPPIDPATGKPVPEKQHFEDFYDEVFAEFSKYGVLEDMHVVTNLGDHMFGNVYLKYADYESATECLKHCNRRMFAGRELMGEYSPVTNFFEARCRRFDDNNCIHGEFCNFAHMMPLSGHTRRMIRRIQDDKRKQKSVKRKTPDENDKKQALKFFRSTSRERRRIIMKWNLERDTEMEAIKIQENIEK